MARIRLLIALGLVLVLAGSSYAGKGSGKRKHPVRGTVSTVSTDSMVVKVKQGKEKGGETTEETFQLGSDTKFEFLTVARHAKGEKPEITTTPAALSDVKPGERVRISAGSGTAAETVSIVKHARGGKKSAD
ncbi:MAG TPA: hypothetical protein VHY91_03635 [Pirellulales bacterium]|jgi:hypothetical protein|nr:hypothetical protein [Pirellulales bacterium]